MVASEASKSAVLLYYFCNYISLLSPSCTGTIHYKLKRLMEDQYKSAGIKRVLFGEAKKVRIAFSGVDFIHALTTVKESGKERSRGLFNEDG